MLLPRDINPHVLATDFNRKTVEHLPAGQQVCSGPDVILPTVPGAGDAMIVDRSLADRSSLMRADAIDRIDRVAHQKHCYDPAADQQFLANARREFFQLARQLICHADLPFA